MARLADGDAGRRAVGEGQQHPAEDLLRGKAVLAVGIAVAEDVGLAEGRRGGWSSPRCRRWRTPGTMVAPRLVSSSQNSWSGASSRRFIRAGMFRGIDRKWPNRPALVVQVTRATSGLIPLSRVLHPTDQVFHAAVGPVLIAAEGRDRSCRSLGISAPVSLR